MVAFRQGREYGATFSGDVYDVEVKEGGEKFLLSNGDREEIAFEETLLVEGFNGRKGRVARIYTADDGDGPLESLEHQPLAAPHTDEVSLRELAEEIGKEMESRAEAYA